MKNSNPQPSENTPEPSERRYLEVKPLPLMPGVTVTYNTLQGYALTEKGREGVFHGKIEKTKAPCADEQFARAFIETFNILPKEDYELIQEMGSPIVGDFTVLGNLGE